MNQPKPDNQEQNPEPGNKTADNSSTGSATVENVNTTPGAHSPQAPQENSRQEDRPAHRAKIAEAVTDWLRHYWEKPREKSKRSEIATVILLFLTAVAAFWSAWIFQGQLSEMRNAQRPWVGLKNNIISVASSPEFGPANPHNPNLFLVLVNTSYTVRNFGTASAFNEINIVNAVADTGANIPPTNQIRNSCNYAEALSTTRGAANPGAGEMVLPRQSVPVREGTSLTFDPSKLKHIGRIWIFVCIAYQDARHKVHYSRYWYLTVHKDLGSGPQIPVPGHPGFTYMTITGVNLWGADTN